MARDDAVNIASFLPAIAGERPYAPAIFCPSGRTRDGRVRYVHCTYRQLNDDSDCIARGLEKIGIGRGVRTVLMVRPSLEFFALVFAIFKAGAVPVLVDPGIGRSNLRICLAEAQPEAFIGIPVAQAARVVLRWGQRTIRTIVTVGHKLLWGGVTLDQVRAAGSDRGPYDLRVPRADDVAAIAFTSGNTGVSKGVVYTHGNLAAQLDILRSTYDIQPGEVDLATFPPFALFGPALGLTTIVPDMDFTRPAAVDATKIIQALDDFGVTNMFGSPALLNAVARYAAPRGFKFPSLRRVISAGAPVPPAVLAQFSTLLNPDTQIFTPYGATEALPVCSIGSREILSDARAKTESGAGICVGWPVAPTQVRVIRISDEAIERWDESLGLPDGEIGEIAVSGPIVTRSYFNRPQATALAKIYDRRDGGLWHRMGDVGYFDAQGRLWFCGRKVHRVRTPQGTLFTEPCEEVFNTHPAVFRSALVAVQQNGHSTPVLCVQLEEHARHNEHEKIRRELLALGTSQPHTQAIQTVLFHPRFPVDIRHNAKILREALAIWAQKQLS